MSRRLRVLVAALSCAGLALGITITSAVGAAAHGELIRSDPADGAVLAAAPRAVTLTFREAVSARQSSVSLDSRALPLRQPAGQPTVLVADLGASRTASPAQPAGRWVIVWRSVSEEDGHAEWGTIRFRVAGATGGEQPAPAQAGTRPEQSTPAPPKPDPAVRTAMVLVRVAGYLGLALFLGGLAFLTFLWPEGAFERRTRRLLVLAWSAGMVATILGIVLQGAYANLLPLPAAFRRDVIAEVLTSHFGAVWAAKALLWLLAAVVLTGLLQSGARAVRSPGWRVSALAVSVGLLRTAGMTSHAAEGRHSGWGAVADFVHLAGVSLWLGGLAVLLVGVLPRRRADELAAVVPRYSGYALAAVTGIVAAGTLLAWQLVGSVHDVLYTGYGRLLLVKLAVFALVLLVARHSRSWVASWLGRAVPPRGDVAGDGTGEVTTVRLFAYSVAAETALVLVVLSVASVLVTANPGR